MKHTPGPWRMTRFDDGDIFIEGASKLRAAICRILPPCGHYTHGENGDKIDVSGENIANARLIAKAPEMLEALKAYVEDVSKDSDGDDRTMSAMEWHWMKKFNALIAQIEGGE